MWAWYSCGFCDDTHASNVSEDGVQLAISPRGSMGTLVARDCVNLRVTTWAAPANAAWSSGVSPTDIAWARFVPRSGWTTSSGSSSAVSAPMMAGWGSMRT